MNELSYDQLLGVETNHTISCPEINPLKFSGDMCSKIYKINLDFDPELLYINLLGLRGVTEQLNKWSTGLLNIYNSLPEKIKETISFDLESFNNYLEIDHIDEIRTLAGEINSHIEGWIEYRNEKENYKNLIIVNDQETLEVEKKILLLTFSDKDLLEDSLSLLDYYQNEKVDLIGEIDNIEANFDKYIADDFENDTVMFSNILEILRERNDNLRSLSVDLKSELIKNASEYLNLYQPLDYLDKIKPCKPNEINIGVLFNSLTNEKRTEMASYYSQISKIGNKAGFSFEEKNKLMDLYKDKNKVEIKEYLFKMLKEKGFKTIRYYLNDSNFLNNMDSYNEINFKTKIKNKIFF